MPTDQQRQYHRDWYHKNAEKRLADKRRYQAAIRQELEAIKTERGCQECGERDFRCLDFHHRDPEEKMLQLGCSYRRVGREKIMAEVEKCSVLCANCHRKHHYC